MYFVKKDGGFAFCGCEEGAVARILAPVAVENSHEYELSFVQNGLYSSPVDRVTLTVTDCGQGLFRLRREWTNLANHTRHIRTVLRVETLFTPKRYLIPCVSVNGNEFGEGGEPKGYAHEGKPWIFAYDRCSIPACTLTENAELALSLFASADDVTSLESACSLYPSKDGKHFVQEIHHPVVEGPLCYSKRDGYTPGYSGLVTLCGGETFTIEAYLLLSCPRWENYGICDTLDAALTLFPPVTPTSLPPKKQIWDDSLLFAESLLRSFEGKKAFHIGFLPDGKGGFDYRSDDCYQLAWCGQNVLLCRMMIEDFRRTGRRDRLQTALSVLDDRLSCCVSPCGLIAQQLRDGKNLLSACSDTCNLGYGAYELLRVGEDLRKLNVDGERYLNAGFGVCDFFVQHFSDEFGFGKLWRHDGVCLETGGTIGAFLIPALLKAYELSGREDYLSTAKKGMRFYMRRDLDRFVSTAGALDTCCVDKETSAPLIMAGVMLYRLTNDRIYLQYAQKAAYYFTSWMYHYQPHYREDSEVVRYGVCLRGLTSVSAQHHHLDVYASLVVPYLRELADLSGDEAWRERAELMWQAAIQYIGDGTREIHGVVRPVGSQNEAVFQCNWSFGWPGATFERGALNDWLVAWPSAFRLSVLATEDF